MHQKAKSARRQCHLHFWSFAKQLLDNNPTTQMDPKFSRDEATRFFKETYHTEPHFFEHPSWMPSPPTPSVDFDCDTITIEEIAVAVKKTKSTSAPCPFDGIPYIIFKKCPALLVALHDLFNSCWSGSVIPAMWKRASVKLIGKASAEQDPSAPTNFRPIALTPCVGKYLPLSSVTAGCLL